jgi:hypothetical protein
MTDLIRYPALRFGITISGQKSEVDNDLH